MAGRTAVVRLTKRLKTCHWCQNRGTVPCKNCSGRGRIICPSCSGSGKDKLESNADKQQPCHKCGGFGSQVCSGACGEKERYDCPACEKNRQNVAAAKDKAKKKLNSYGYVTTKLLLDQSN